MNRCLEFVKTFSALDRYSFSEGRKIDKTLGISYPPYPEGLQVGAILSALAHLPECIKEESDQIILQQRSGEMMAGFFSFIRTRWPRTIKKKLRISREGKVLGECFESIYALCLEVSPYIPLSREKGSALGVDGPSFFHDCMKEMTLNNSVISMLITLYPPVTSHQKRAYEKSKSNKEECGIYLKAIVTRIKNGEMPSPVPDRSESGQIGYLGTLLHYAVVASNQDEILRKGAFQNFQAATKNYIDLVSSKRYAIARTKPDGIVVLERGKRGSSEKLMLQTAGMPAS